jgi:hypothetical protein
MGMRFSGCLLLALAATLLAGMFLNWWARRSGTGQWCRLAFRTAVGLGLAILSVIEVFVIHEGRKAIPEEGAAAVIVLGAGVNGTEPSLSLKTGWMPPWST